MWQLHQWGNALRKKLGSWYQRWWFCHVPNLGREGGSASCWPSVSGGRLTLVSARGSIKQHRRLLALLAGRLYLLWGFLGGSVIKNLPAMQEPQEMQVQSLGRENPLEKDMATHSSTLAWRIPRTEEPGRLQSMRSQRV